jgi:site-specific recombinase XerD
MSRTRAWSTWQTDFLATLERRGQSPATVKLRKLGVRRFERLCRRLGVSTPADLSGVHYQAMAQFLRQHRSRRGRPYAAVSQHLVLTSVRRFLNWAVAAGRLPAEQLEGVPPDGRRPRPPKPAASGPWTPWQADFLDALRSRGQSAATLSIRAQWLPVFQRFCEAQGVEHPTGVVTRHLEAFQAWLATPQVRLGRPYAPSSQEQALATARLFLRWAVKTRRLLVDPTATVRLHHVPPVMGWVPTVDQVQRLLTPQPSENRYQARDRTVLEVLYGTAVRLGECAALDLTDVNLREGWLRVRYAKGGIQRLLPIGSHLADILQHYLARARPHFPTPGHEPALFVNHLGGRLSTASMASLVQNAGRRCGHPGLHAHVLRRACVTHLLEAGASLEALQRQLGHHGLDALHRYLKVSLETLRAEHHRTHPRTASQALPP